MFKTPVFLGLLTCAVSAMATPVTFSAAGYWLENVGPNTVRIGPPGGGERTFFISNDTSPSANAGTTATAAFPDSSAAPAPGFNGLNWLRGILSTSPDYANSLAGYDVTFTNGSDTAVFRGQSLLGVELLPLALNLSIDGSLNPFSPQVTWTLPSGDGVDVDRIQLLFYNDDTDAQVGGQPTLGGDATSFSITGPLRPGFNLAVNVFLFDLIDDSAAFTRENILRGSRAYVNYTAPLAVPEPTSMLLALAALGILVGTSRLSAS